MKIFRNKNGFLLITLIAVFTVLAVGCKNNQAMPAEDTGKYVIPDSLLETLQIDTVDRCRVINAVTLNGQVSFNEDNIVKIYPMVSGTIRDINVMLGDYVHQGEVLAVINSSEMAGYSTDLVTAQTSLEVAKKNLQAANDMYKSGLSSQTDYLQAQANYEQAKSELKRVQEILQINGGNTQGEYVIKAPISGFIVEKQVTNDMAIRSDNSNDLFTISDLKNVWVIADVYESNISDVHVGDSAQITTLSYPGKIFYGKIDKIMNVLDPVNKVMKVRIVLPNPGYLLKPEMFASVTVTHPENQEALCIPAKDVIFDNSQNYVLIYKSPSNVIIQPITIDKSVGNKSYVSDGLQEGDRILGSQQLLIYQALSD
jgi:membrane fusion protein, heavy metal efflux system